MKSKPLFRFVGNPRQGIRAQLEISMLVQQFFFLVHEKRMDRAAIESGGLNEELSNLKSRLRDLEVVVSGPSWFADLFR